MNKTYRIRLSTFDKIVLGFLGVGILVTSATDGDFYKWIEMFTFYSVICILLNRREEV